jgi:hypothetical protein
VSSTRATAAPPPSTYYDNKYKRPLAEITKQFHYQVESNSCYPTSVTNQLQDLALQHRRPELAIRLAEVNRICGYRDWFGANSEVVVKNLNRHLGPLGYRAYEQNGVGLRELLRILDDDACSYPIIGLKQEYLNVEWGISLGEQRTKPDHTVLLLLQNDEQMGFFDPFEGRTQVMRERNQGNGRGIVVLPTPRISEYWAKAREGSWLMWVRREKKLPRSQTLIDEGSGA